MVYKEYKNTTCIPISDNWGPITTLTTTTKQTNLLCKLELMLTCDQLSQWLWWCNPVLVLVSSCTKQQLLTSRLFLPPFFRHSACCCYFLCCLATTDFYWYFLIIPLNSYVLLCFFYLLSSIFLLQHNFQPDQPNYTQTKELTRGDSHMVNYLINVCVLSR